MNKITAYYPSPIGNILIECTDDFITALLFENKSNDQQSKEMANEELPLQYALLSKCLLQLQE